MALFEQPEKDQFRTESPIRAFTTFTVEGNWALGKGFRPSVAHIVTYLNAMEAKEGWRLVQLLEPTSGSPSFIFRRNEAKAFIIGDEPDRLRHYAIGRESLGEVFVPKEVDEVNAEAYRKAVEDYRANAGKRVAALWESEQRDYGDENPEMQPAVINAVLSAAIDDPVNPAHYNGTACAEIIENLPGNLAHAMTYVWRAGDKPNQPEKQELEKAIWFLEREYHLASGLIEEEDLGLSRWSIKRSPHKGSRGAIGKNPFFVYAVHDRINKAFKADVPPWRPTALVAIVYYAIERKPSNVTRVIELLRERICEIDGADCPEFGRQQEP